MALTTQGCDRIESENMFRSTLLHLLHHRAISTPGEIAFIYLRDGENDEEKISYGELYLSAVLIAKSLVNDNLSGEKAIMFYPPGLEFIKALFGCFYAGIIAVPAYPPRKNRSLDRIRAMVKDSGAKIVLSTEDIRQSIERSFRDVMELQQLTWVTTNHIPSPQASTPPSPQASTPPSLHASLPSSVALLQYTSGSTGKPKGVMVTHHNLMRNLEFLKQAFELSPETIAVHWLPVFHDMGLVFGVLEAIYTGYTGILLPPVSFIQKPSRWLRAISKYKATLAGAPNFAFDLCISDISDDECKELDLSALKSLYNGAEPVRKTTLESFTGKFHPFGFREEMFYPTYGMAEATLILSGGKVDERPVVMHVDKTGLENNRISIISEKDENAYSLVSVGKPWIDTTIIIVDPQNLELCPEDEVGEVWVSGSIVALGYWGNEEETKKVFKAYTGKDNKGPYLRTGDLGFYHDGMLYISGRLKDLIIIRGRNYYPQDLELLTENSHQAIRPNSVAAFSVTRDEIERLVIVAEVERTSMKNLNQDEVSNAIRSKIAEEMELAVYGILLIRTATIMKTSSGKIQRKACKQAFLNHSLEIIGESFLDEYVEEEELSGTKHDLVAIQAWMMTWIHIKLKIRLEKIDFSKPITVYGLNSMKAVQLQQDFLENFQINFPPYLFFERISLRELAERALSLINESK